VYPARRWDESNARSDAAQPVDTASTPIVFLQYIAMETSRAVNVGEAREVRWSRQTLNRRAWELRPVRFEVSLSQVGTLSPHDEIDKRAVANVDL